jgi:predicted cation transporter
MVRLGLQVQMHLVLLKILQQPKVEHNLQDLFLVVKVLRQVIQELVKNTMDQDNLKQLQYQVLKPWNNF